MTGHWLQMAKLDVTFSNGTTIQVPTPAGMNQLYTLIGEELAFKNAPGQDTQLWDVLYHHLEVGSPGAPFLVDGARIAPAFQSQAASFRGTVLSPEYRPIFDLVYYE